MYEEIGKSITTDGGGITLDKFEDNVTLTQLTDEYKEAIDIIPSLHKYKSNHNITNLQKLCVEISDFCRAVYSSTQNDEERKVYFDFVKKLNKN